MTKKYRLILFILSFITLFIISLTIDGNIVILVSNFWFSSGLLLLILLSLIDQPHFSKDSNIFVNAITAAISLLLVNKTDYDWVFFLFLGVVGYLLISSYILIFLRNNPLNEENKVFQFISRLNRIIGNPQVLFSAFFLWGAIKQFGLDSTEMQKLFWYWFVFQMLNISQLAKILDSLFSKDTSKNANQILGKIFGVQSKNTFLVKLNPKKPVLNMFDFVEFQYSVDSIVRQGLIIDNYLLNEEQWVKVLYNKETYKIFNGNPLFENHKKDIVYKITNVPKNDYLTRLIGIITENSTIDKIRFIYNSKVNIEESQLLSLEVNNKIVLYQIIEGVTKVEQLQNKNQTGLIIGEAIQLGIWDDKKLQFEQFGWVPEINTPVYIASNIPNYRLGENELEIGRIPNTNFPVILNKDTAITHHMAVIGVTGTGKSIFSRNLIREYVKDENTKVICIDFTGEYHNKFLDLTPSSIINKELENELFQQIDSIENEINANYGKENAKTKFEKQQIYESMQFEIKNFITSSKQLSIVELPEVENTAGILTYTKIFFSALFNLAKKKEISNKRICLVLEEAHTIIPEWNFSGTSNKDAQALLNSISQIALQGRKYNVGLLVIAQRTANVSKTILTQCNTIVSFQELDKTSSDFLANYYGSTIVKILPKLKFRQAIAAGKAFKSSVPMIFEVPEIKEPESTIQKVENVVRKAIPIPYEEDKKNNI